MKNKPNYGESATIKPQKKKIEKLTFWRPLDIEDQAGAVVDKINEIIERINNDKE